MDSTNLSKRERQIMDIIYRRGAATAIEVHEDLNKDPGYSAVRTLLRILEEKGYLRHETKGKQYLYSPIVPRETAIKTAIRNLKATFFNNSTEQTVAALLEAESLSESDLDRLAALIEKAREEGR